MVDGWFCFAGEEWSIEFIESIEQIWISLYQWGMMTIVEYRYDGLLVPYERGKHHPPAALGVSRVPGFWLMANSHENSDPGEMAVCWSLSRFWPPKKGHKMETTDDTCRFNNIIWTCTSCWVAEWPASKKEGHFDVAILAGDVQMPYPADLYRTSSVVWY